VKLNDYIKNIISNIWMRTLEDVKVCSLYNVYRIDLTKALERVGLKLVYVDIKN
jgi:hypothetical protein